MIVRTGPALTAFLDDCAVVSLRSPRLAIRLFDLRGGRTPRSRRSTLHHRMTELQASIMGSGIAERAVVVVLVDDDRAERAVHTPLENATCSLVQAVERRRGTSFGLTAIIRRGPCDEPEIANLLRYGITAVPEGAAVITWNEARVWGIRAAVAAQLI